MFLPMLKGMLTTGRRAAAFVLISTLASSVVCSALISLSMQISDRISEEFRSYGANILVQPVEEREGGGIQSADVARLKVGFWRNNILNAAPFAFGRAQVSETDIDTPLVVAGTWFARPIPIPGQKGSWKVGVRTLAGWWKVEGAWPREEQTHDVLVGAEIARVQGLDPGATVKLQVGQRTETFYVVGILHTGGNEDRQIFGHLATIQRLLGFGDTVSHILVNALTNPLDGLGEKNPSDMSTLEYEKWICTPYVNSVALDIEGNLPGTSVRPLWKVADAEGRIYQRLKWMFILLTMLAAAAGAITVGSTLMSLINEHRTEIGLMKALGASNASVASLYLQFVFLISAAAGLIAWPLGTQLLHWIGATVFETQLDSPWMFVTAMATAVGAGVCGALIPLIRATRLIPAQTLADR